MDVYVYAYAYDVNGYRREPSFVGWGRRTYRLFLLGAFPPKVTAWPDPTKLEQTRGRRRRSGTNLELKKRKQTKTTKKKCRCCWLIFIWFRVIKLNLGRVKEG